MILQFFGGLEYLIDLGLVDALDVAELLLCGHHYARNSAKATGLQLGDIGCVDSVLLQLFNLDEVGLLDVLQALFLPVLLLLPFHLLLLVLGLLLLLHGAQLYISSK
jgi:hypothetical protein